MVRVVLVVMQRNPSCFNHQPAEMYRIVIFTIWLSTSIQLFSVAECKYKYEY